MSARAGDREGRAKSRFPIIGWGLLSGYTNWALEESGTWSLWLFLILTPILIYICLFFWWRCSSGLHYRV